MNIEARSTPDRVHLRGEGLNNRSPTAEKRPPQKASRPDAALTRVADG